MHLRPLAALLAWALTLGAVGGLLFGLYWIHEAMKAEHAREEGEKVASRDRVKDGSVEIEEEEAERIGLEVAAARAVDWCERVAVYGRVVPNPRATAEVRTPFAGTLRAAAASPWPAPGTWVRSGQVLGWVDVRVGPEVRLDMQNKLAEARIRQRGAEDVIQLQQGRVDSLKKVTSQEIISRAELDAALVQLAEARTQAATAKAAAELWQKALDEIDRRAEGQTAAWSQPLAAPADGEVAELVARPGMAVEAGALVVQLVDFRRLLVRLDVPPDVLSAGPPKKVGLIATPAIPQGHRGILRRPEAAETEPAVEAVLAGPAPQRDLTSQFVGYWYEVASARTTWRPGLQVQAHFRPAGAAVRQAVSVPATAVLYHEGRALVYVRIKPNRFQRREVALLGREGDCWILSRRQGEAPVGVAPNEPVVIRQAQVLLSEEFRRGGGDAD
jgi:hypothetical protein